jgi:hypothetical protein
MHVYMHPRPMALVLWCPRDFSAALQNLCCTALHGMASQSESGPACSVASFVPWGVRACNCRSKAPLWAHYSSFFGPFTADSSFGTKQDASPGITALPCIAPQDSDAQPKEEDPKEKQEHILLRAQVGLVAAWKKALLPLAVA